MSLKAGRSCAAGATVYDDAFNAESIAIDAWTAIARLADGKDLDDRDRLAVKTLTDSLRADASALTYARTHGTAGTPPTRASRQPETLLRLMREAARSVKAFPELVQDPETGAAKMADALDQAVQVESATDVETLDKLLERLTFLASESTGTSGERITV